MEKNLTIQEYLNNFRKYYQKISISIILGKSKKDSIWYCMNMKILFLRKDGNIDKDFYLLNEINKENIEIRFYDLPIDKFDIAYQALQRKIELNGESYHFYSNQSSSDSNDYLNSTSNIGTFDSNYEGYSGYLLTKCYFSGSFYSMIKDFSLTETDIGIDEEDFPQLFNMDKGYFNSHNLYIIFPFFIKKLSSRDNYFEYVIDNDLFNDIKIRLYNDKINLINYIKLQRNNNSTIIKIPLFLEERNITFELYHHKFGEIIKEKLDNMKHSDNDTIRIDMPNEVEIEKLNVKEKRINIFLNYASEDLNQAKKLYDILNLDYNVWFDKESLLPGQDWEEEIENAIKNSDNVILLFSSRSIDKKGMVQKEYKLALDVLKQIPFGQIFIIPVRLDDCKIPSPFQRYHYIDLFPEWNKGISKILKSIKLDKT